jgi:uncharacterized protein (DUF924 family)
MTQLNEAGGKSVTIGALLDFWFGALVAGVATPEKRRRWFAADADFDREVAQRFGALVEDAAAGRLDAWCASPHGTLAFVLVTDQFPRQVFRATARAFATDPIARDAARRAIARGDDRGLGVDERAFLYLPFEHSERLSDQDECLRLFAALAAEASPQDRSIVAGFLEHARIHRDLIARFGRFPHRNRVLDRTSTPEEEAYLRTASGFGQLQGRGGEPSRTP